MKSSIVIIVVVVLVVAFESLMVYLYRKNEQSKKDYVGLPAVYFYVGCFFVLFSMLPLIAVGLETNVFLDPVCWIFIGMDFLMVLMCLNQVNWRIVPMKNEMVYRNCLRFKKIISYDSIRKIKTLKSGDTLIFVDGKMFPIVIDKFASGLESLISLYNSYVLQRR